MFDQIEIPESFPSPGAVSGSRVVITVASRGLGALLAHACSNAGASVALVARTGRDKAVAQALPGPSLVLSGVVMGEDFNEAVADATWPSGVASTCGSATRELRPLWLGHARLGPWSGGRSSG